MGKPQGAPIIVRRVKKIEGGHHGGAWKVAYADFVTAMMAFFLMMWLLSSTSEDMRSGIADYFSPTVPVSPESGGGDGALMGITAVAQKTDPGAGDGTDSRQRAEDGAATEADLESLAQTLSGEDSPLPDELRRHIATRITDEGLIVELSDLPDRPLFDPDEVTPTPIMSRLLDVIGEAFAPFVNDVAIGGHVKSAPVVLRDPPDWRLSTGRADTVRRLLTEGELAAHRVRRVVGHADRNPAREDRMDPRNNRIELTLLR
ncbi:chemotaxis protein MotB [Palleronia sediminis]|uniref:Chemotaxis protein MotB n=1 Tax=Palleronia sediminis TaxID=2547833 RepID=A0A4R5ZYA0_9RHOB|nr:flagellar motor protein MotB [Palleronia sediminis]TDL75234.1 chemotaxis protein MotB [Palleronia sediminis]